MGLSIVPLVQEDHHQDVSLPSQERVAWRYLSFTQFVSILEREQLWFSRLDCLGDHFEGSYPPANKEERKSNFYEDFKEDLSEDEARRKAEDFTRGVSRFYKALRLGLYVNCWHGSPYENDAMWSKYGDRGIAVRTKVALFQDALKPERRHVNIGEVQYIDFNSETIPEPWETPRAVYLAALYKRKAFEHEREVRLIHPDFDIIGSLLEEGTVSKEFYRDQVETRERGFPIKVDLDSLVTRLYVAPTAPEWYVSLTREVVERYGYDWDVAHSGLAQPASY